MSSIGTGYDLQSSQFSPDGRVFQVEYAQKAVENSGTVIGITAKDGVILAVEKLIDSELFEAEANRRIFHIDSHIGMTVAGLLADARQIVEIARKEASSFRSTYDRPIPCRVLADRVSMHMHMYTLYSFVRPFGCSIILSSYEEDRPLLFTIEPSGTYHGYYGCAFGKAMQAAKTEIEKLKIKHLTMTQMVTEAAKILLTVHDEVKDKKFELEMSWIGADTNCEHQLIPDAIKLEAENRAKASIQQESEDDDNGM